MNFSYTPKAKPIRPSNPSVLEMAIHRYQCLAIDYHNKKNLDASLIKETPAELKERIESLERDWEHLQLERKKIVTQVILQKNLESYRKENLQKDEDELFEEPHHPTRLLARNLSAIGEPKPSPDHDPHHIIPGKGQHQQVRLMETRLALHAHGIGINDPLNGVWLPRNKKHKGHWAGKNTPAHREIHSFNYETWIVSTFSSPLLPKQAFVSRLQNVKRKLLNGDHPSQIIEKKDTNWAGKV
ncbi:hypothetical protein MSP8886_01828 [Marinomonas spartinae]|uniref:A nuclease family of the HNH/ENDO VII superfamily with conserved AHH n=1 Tax=Marinomonas spartinae TaxID=1792290 RepID=A0A1A8TEH7_9GAMM|nr:AHH domain-containing protein [Marinomonas spartinae]SBS30485.1 hypothetical protein MSP8886_01828 [Marinomonas spartinae]